MRTRLVLASFALLALVALAGCAHPAGSIRMEQVNDDELAERASYATRGADLYPSIYEQRLARRIIERGPVTLLAGRPPLESDLPYRYRGAYYNVSRDVIDTRPGASTLVRVDYNATSPEGARVAFDDLPRIDRERLGPVLANPPAIRRPGPEATLPLYYSRSARANSTLLDHAQANLVVTYRGESYVVSIDQVREGPLQVLRYEATPVAESTAAYARHLKRTYAFALSGLNDSEKRVIESAIEEGYYASGPDDAGFASLVERFRRHRAITGGGEYSGSWLATYQGRYYWVEMDYGAFVGETPTTDTPNVTPH